MAALPGRGASIMTGRLASLLIALTALVGLAALMIVAPDYLTARGFPLDDAWIHAVYGRELVRSGMLAYNPGIPATGSTAPLWSAVFALAHALTARVGSMLVVVKLIGFALHVGTACLVYVALADAARPGPMRLAGALLVAIHPDLLSASVSGMEVPLATFLAVALWVAAARAAVPWYALISGAAVLARPELTVVSVCVPLLIAARSDRRRVRLAVAAACASLAVMGTMALRNLSVSGSPLPATFYAKVGKGPELVAALELGCRGLLGELPIVDSSILVTGVALIALMVVARPEGRAGLVAAASAFVTGVIYCLVSFVLIAPLDPGAFYHQRYVLPALPLMVGPAPLLVDAWLTERASHRVVLWTRAALLGVIGLSLVIALPARFEHLANDARNIDDVQVAVGRTLGAAPSQDVVWAIDAGAIRYFGGAFVVDMIGLNTPEMIGPNAAAFLSAHQPRYLEVVPGWSSLGEPEAGHLERALFKPSTPYTVTGFQPMQTHVLVRCAAATDLLRFTVGTRTFEARCAGGAPG